MRFFLETKQQSQATTIENLKSETGWEFTVLLMKKTECITKVILQVPIYFNNVDIKIHNMKFKTIIL